MKVIFTATVKDVALKGDIKNVSEGYFRNYLMPRELAVHATDNALRAWETRRKELMLERENLVKQFDEMKRRLADGKVVIEKKVTSKGTLYGGIKPGDVARAIKESMKVDITEEMISVPDHIKAVGMYSVGIKLGEGVSTQLDIEVVKK